MQILKNVSKSALLSLALLGTLPAVSFADPGTTEAINSESAERRNIVGMEIGNITPEQKAETGYTAKGGVYVSAVIEKHPAAIGGMEAGDVITKINGQDVMYVSEALDVMNSLEPGRNYDFIVHRNVPGAGSVSKTLSILVEAVQERAIGKIS
jgi:S1-C subfamily serine protease